MEILSMATKGRMDLKLWSKTRKNAASSVQLFVGQSFQVNSQFSFFRKANHQ